MDDRSVAHDQAFPQEAAAGDVHIPLAMAMPAYVAVPTGDGPWPGVIVLSDAMGMTTDLRRQTDWLASAGYVALAPDLFFRGGRISCLRTIFRDAIRGAGQTFDDIEASRAWLASRGDCTGRVGVIGFCLGGGFALMLVADRGFSVASANYGGIPKDFERFVSQACPIVGSYGARDYSLRGTAGELERMLTDAGVVHDVKEYPEAGHSFQSDHDANDFNVLVKVLAWVSNSHYNAAAAQDSRERILAFFDDHLQPEGQGA